MKTHEPSPIHLQQVEVRFGRRQANVLDGLDLDAAPGQVTVLLGANGSGKSTLFQVLLGLVKPHSGSVRLQGHDPFRHHREAMDRVGFVPDVPDVPQHTTPRELFAMMARIDASWSTDRCNELVERFAIPVARPVGKLSRGQGMKAMLTTALAIGPRVLLLDEPFAGLDPVARDEVLELIIDALGDEPRTVLCATHDLDVATRIADHIALLEGGRIVRHEATATFAHGALRPSDLRRVMVGARAKRAFEGAV